MPEPRIAIYQDVLDAPEHLVAEIISGRLYLSPGPPTRNVHARSRLVALLGALDLRDKQAPSVWFQPELHLGGDVLVPDLAMWRNQSEAMAGGENHFTAVPDWVCEIVAPGYRGT